PPHLERALVRLEPDGSRVPRGEGAHRFVARHALAGLPVGVLAVSGPSREGSMEAMEGIGILHGEIGAARDVRSRVEHRPPGVSALEAPGAEALSGPAHVRGAVSRLHARHHSETGEAWNVRGIQDLRVLDAKMRAWAGAGQPLLEDVQHESVGTIADGMHPHVKAAARRFTGETLYFFRRHQDQPAVRRVVAVRRMESRATGAEGAVEPELDGAHGELPVSHGDGTLTLSILGPGFLAAEGRESAKGEAAALDEARVRGDGGGVETGLVRSRQALGPALPESPPHR